MRRAERLSVAKAFAVNGDFNLRGCDPVVLVTGLRAGLFTGIALRIACLGGAPGWGGGVS